MRGRDERRATEESARETEGKRRKQSGVRSSITISEKKQLHVSLSLLFLPRRSPRRRVERLLSSTESNSDRLKLGYRWREREVFPSESERSEKGNEKK